MMDIVRFPKKAHHVSLVPFCLHHLMLKLWVHNTAHIMHRKDNRGLYHKRNLKQDEYSKKRCAYNKCPANMPNCDDLIYYKYVLRKNMSIKA